jgi:predicted nucleic acid-binding protein
VIRRSFRPCGGSSCAMRSSSTNGVDGSRNSRPRFLRNVERLAITIDGTPDESGVLTLARRHRLTVYDAAYLELAVRNALPLATLDAMLATAARSEGVPLFGDDAG